MSDSEDDFMSDKFLVDAPTPTSESYTARRSAAQLKSLRAGQAKATLSHKQREEAQRREGMATSLFEKRNEAEGSGRGGGGRAVEMMLKMGWKVGEGLGRKRSISPVLSQDVKRSRNAEKEEEREEEPPRGGIGSTSRVKELPRTEPIRVSMWAGRKGLSARSPSPPPLPQGRNPDALDPRKMARLGEAMESFRERQRREFGDREVERKAGRAREVLVRFDGERGVKVG